MVCALSVKNTAMLITSLLLSHYCRTALRPSPALEGVPGVASSFQASIPECHLPLVFAHCSLFVRETLLFGVVVTWNLAGLLRCAASSGSASFCPLPLLYQMAASYGYDISRPATNAREAVQWLYFG